MFWGSLLRRHLAVQLRQHVGSIPRVMPTCSCLSSRGKVAGVHVLVSVAGLRDQVFDLAVCSLRAARDWQQEVV